MAAFLSGHDSVTLRQSRSVFRMAASNRGHGTYPLGIRTYSLRMHPLARGAEIALYNPWICKLLASGLDIAI